MIKTSYTIDSPTHLSFEVDKTSGALLMTIVGRSTVKTKEGVYNADVDIKREINNHDALELIHKISSELQRFENSKPMLNFKWPWT
jgi:hypothetical protein